MFRTSQFDKLLDKATSNLRLDPDWPAILQICDLIRQNDITPKYAVAAVKKKLYSQNPHQAMFSLLTLESIVKNCGSGVHDEVASKPFCETLQDLVKSTPHENLKTKILELVQAWAFAFRNTPKYRAVQDIVNILKAEGCKFPPLKESDAMFSADTAPEWADGENCHRCRVAFSLMVRRHHCRACGQVFCQQCSSKTSTLPKFGIEKEVRVCDACYDKVSRPPTSSTKVESASDYPPTTQPQKPPGKSAEELQEEEELQLALALSQSEAEQKEKDRSRRTHTAPEPTSLRPTLSPTPSSISASPEHNGVTNSELSRYLDRNYWEARSREQPTAPTPSSTGLESEPEYSKPLKSKLVQEDDAEDKEIDEFVDTLRSQIEIFVNRMKSNSSRGRSIANDTSVQTLFMNITTMHSRLLRHIQQLDDKRVYLESLQDKVTQVRDSRAALDTLRAEHLASMAAAQEAAERQKQMQMAAKLAAMRKKKHEYLQYQRSLALRRVQEQEREMQMRQEQQKHQYLASTNSGYYMPGGALPQFQAGYPNPALYANPQFHPQMLPQATNEMPMTLPGQPKMTQPNMMGINQMGTVQQPMPQHNTFPTTSAMTQPLTQSAFSQANVRPGQQVPLTQQQMMMQQMQIRMQAGMMPIKQPGATNGIPGQNPPHNDPSLQLGTKQNLPNQSQQQNLSTSMPMGPQSLGQPMMNTNPMIGMQIQNMRMPNMNSAFQSYPVNVNLQNQQPVPQNPEMQQSQLPGQPLSLQNQSTMQGRPLSGQNQAMPVPNHVPTSQSIPQGPQPQAPNLPQQMNMTQGQQMMHQSAPQMTMQMMNQHLQGQNPVQSQPMSIHMGQNQVPVQQNQNIPGQQYQQMPSNNMQQMPIHMQGQQQMQGLQGQIPQNMMPGAPQMPQQMPQNQQGQMVQAQQIHQGQPIANPQMQMNQHIQNPQMAPSQMQQTQQLPQNVQAHVKFDQPGFTNGVPQNPIQPPQNQLKAESNNNTSELISFD